MVTSIWNLPKVNRLKTVRILVELPKKSGGWFKDASFGKVLTQPFRKEGTMEGRKGEKSFGFKSCPNQLYVDWEIGSVISYHTIENPWASYS